MSNRSSSSTKSGGIKLNRKVLIEKFNPHQVSPTTCISSHVPQSHVKVVSGKLPEPRWPMAVLNKKDIENKPWYIRSLEEVCELECGDETRVEKYPSYNKSFVCKVDPTITDGNHPDKAFGSRLNPKRHYPKLYSNKNSNNGKSNTTEPVPSYCTQTASSLNRTISFDQEIPTASPSSSSSRRSSISSTEKNSISSRGSMKPRCTPQEQIARNVQKEIKKLKMKPSELEAHIKITNQKIKELESVMESDQNHMKTVVEKSEMSSQVADRLRIGIAQMMALLRKKLQHIIQQRQKARSIQSNAALDRQIKYWETTYYSQLHNTYSNNIDALESVLIREARRDEVKKLVIRGLLRWAKRVLIVYKMKTKDFS